MRAPSGAPVRRILAIRPRALGDLILTTPALRALRRGYPEARLTLLVDRHYAELARSFPEVDDVVSLERSTAAMPALIAALRRGRFDLAIDFFGNPRTALLTQTSGARRRAGYDLRGRRHAYDVRVPRAVVPERGAREYAAAVHVRLAGAVGGIDDGVEPRLAAPADPGERAAWAALGIADPGRCIGLLAAGTWATKTWPIASAGSLARRLMAAGWQVLVLGGPGEEHVATTLAALAPGIAILPPCGIVTLAARLARLGAVVGTDSGPRHLAAALGVPTFAWFGPTHPDTWSPPGEQHGNWWTDLPCRGCDRTACPHWSCMPSLTPAHAAERVLDHLDRHVRSRADLRTAAGA